MILHFQNARLVDPEAQAVEPSTLTLSLIHI